MIGQIDEGQESGLQSENGNDDDERVEEEVTNNNETYQGENRLNGMDVEVKKSVINNKNITKRGYHN